jgi:hypothetical protein
VDSFTAGRRVPGCPTSFREISNKSGWKRVSRLWSARARRSRVRRFVCRQRRPTAQPRVVPLPKFVRLPDFAVTTPRTRALNAWLTLRVAPDETECCDW